MTLPESFKSTDTAATSGTYLQFGCVLPTSPDATFVPDAGPAAWTGRQTLVDPSPIDGDGMGWPEREKEKKRFLRDQWSNASDYPKAELGGSKLNDDIWCAGGTALFVFSPWRQVETNVRAARGAHSEPLPLADTGSTWCGQI